MDEGARAGGVGLALSQGLGSGAGQQQRARILGALAGVVAERGFAGASVGLVIARARVSRRTFYECFDGLEDCFTAILDVGSVRTGELVSGAFAGEDCWEDGVRSALASLLVFLGSEPLLARVWLVESLGAGSWALEHRERNLGVLRELVVGGWPVSGSWSSPSPLAAEGVMSAVLGVLHAHIVTGKQEPLIELLGPLMGLVAGPYLSAKGVAREVQRGEDLARAIQAGKDPRWAPPPGTVERGAAALHEMGQDAVMGKALLDGALGGAIPGVLCNPAARRVRECLLFLAEHPGSSNSGVAIGIGVAHRSQISKLLGYLLHEKLATKHSEGPGKPNAWQLTPHGQEIARALAQQR